MIYFFSGSGASNVYLPEPRREQRDIRVLLYGSGEVRVQSRWGFLSAPGGEVIITPPFNEVAFYVVQVSHSTFKWGVRLPSVDDVSLFTAIVTVAAIPAADTEIGSAAFRRYYVVRPGSSVRVSGNATTAPIVFTAGVQYSRDGGATWSTLSAATVTGAVPFTSSWLPAPVDSTAHVILRPYTSGGDGVSTVRLASFSLQVV